MAFSTEPFPRPQVNIDPALERQYIDNVEKRTDAIRTDNPQSQGSLGEMTKQVVNHLGTEDDAFEACRTLMSYFGMSKYDAAQHQQPHNGGLQWVQGGLPQLNKWVKGIVSGPVPPNPVPVPPDPGPTPEPPPVTGKVFYGPDQIDEYLYAQSDWIQAAFGHSSVPPPILYFDPQQGQPGGPAAAVAKAPTAKAKK